MANLNCHNGHALINTLREVSFRCNGCDAQSVTRECSFWCDTCDYDLCAGCASQRLPMYCPQEHALTRYVTPRPGFRCNLCRSTFPQNAVAASCRGCNYDVCDMCISKQAYSSDKALPVMTPPRSAPGPQPTQQAPKDEPMDCCSCLTSILCCCCCCFDCEDDKNKVHGSA